MEETTEPRHLRRLAVVWQRQPLYFVTACVERRRSMLANPTAHDVLLGALVDFI